jgi:hypothetical protein
MDSLSRLPREGRVELEAKLGRLGESFVSKLKLQRHSEPLLQQRGENFSIGLKVIGGNSFLSS